jgi:glutamate-1-semialdehyde 2,1-aminomutase
MRRMSPSARANTGGCSMTNTNEALFARAQACIPAGVNSPVRAFRAVGGTPPFF